MILAPMPFLIMVVVFWGLVWPVNKVLLESLSPLWAMDIALRRLPAPLSVQLVTTRVAARA